MTESLLCIAATREIFCQCCAGSEPELLYSQPLHSCSSFERVRGPAANEIEMPGTREPSGRHDREVKWKEDWKGMGYTHICEPSSECSSEDRDRSQRVSDECERRARAAADARARRALVRESRGTRRVRRRARRRAVRAAETSRLPACSLSDGLEWEWKCGMCSRWLMVKSWTKLGALVSLSRSHVDAVANEQHTRTAHTPPHTSTATT